MIACWFVVYDETKYGRCLFGSERNQIVLAPWHAERDPPLNLLLRLLLPQTIRAKLRIVLDVVRLGAVVHLEASLPDRDLQDRVDHAILCQHNEVILKPHG